MTIAILGGGIMGQALLEGALASGRYQIDDFRVTTARASSAAALQDRLGVGAGTSNAEAVAGADLVILSVKPKTMRALCEEIGPHLTSGAAVASVAAGVALDDLESWLPDGTPVLRCMPNTPCRIGCGMTALSSGRDATEAHLTRAESFFASLGRTLRLAEEHMDTVTGLSASGPAFLYLIIESLADGGVMAGLPRGAAVELAAQTVQGAARMVLETGEHPAALKDAVTTPAGCTISALLKLEDGRLRSVLARAVEEAAAAAARLRTQGQQGSAHIDSPAPRASDPSRTRGQ